MRSTNAFKRQTASADENSEVPRSAKYSSCLFCSASSCAIALRMSELLPDRRGTVADLVDRLLKRFLRDVQVPGPILKLVGFVHVDLAAILKSGLLQVVHGASLGSLLNAPENRGFLTTPKTGGDRP